MYYIPMIKSKMQEENEVKNQMWNKVKRMMAGVMMAALLIMVARGTFGVEDTPGISVYGDASEPHDVFIQ